MEHTSDCNESGSLDEWLKSLEVEPPNNRIQRWLDQCSSSSNSQKSSETVDQPSLINSQDMRDQCSSSSNFQKRNEAVDPSLINSLDKRAPVRKSKTPVKQSSAKRQRSSESDSSSSVESNMDDSRFHARGWRRNARLYTFEEDLIIVNYVLHKSRLRKVNGNIMWQQMEHRKVLPERTWQSMRARYLSHIRKSLDKYKDHLDDDFCKQKLTGIISKEALPQTKSSCSQSKYPSLVKCSKKTKKSSSKKSLLIVNELKDNNDQTCKACIPSNSDSSIKLSCNERQDDQHQYQGACIPSVREDSNHQPPEACVPSDSESPGTSLPVQSVSKRVLPLKQSQEDHILSQNGISNDSHPVCSKCFKKLPSFKVGNCALLRKEIPCASSSLQKHISSEHEDNFNRSETNEEDVVDVTSESKDESLSSDKSIDKNLLNSSNHVFHGILDCKKCSSNSRISPKSN